MHALVDAGLGLTYGQLRLVPVPDEWSELGRELAADMAAALGPLAIAVEHVGSTAVPGLVAKPIIDLAIGLGADADAHAKAIENRLAVCGWIYRGDAGENGGHVYALESQPLVRVAHAHGVTHQGSQWGRYIEFRDRLRSSPMARESYSNTKLTLLQELGSEDSRRSYTERKSPVIDAIFASRD